MLHCTTNTIIPELCAFILPPSHFLLSQKKVLTRMQQKQVTKKAAVARKVNGSRGVTIFNLETVEDI